MSKRILITGGAGFVGSHLADALLERGHQVRVFDNLTQQVHPDGRPAYLDREIEFIQGDMRDGERLAAALSGIELVFHLAAAVGVGQSMHEIARYLESNTQGTANLLQALLRNRKQRSWWWRRPCPFTAKDNIAARIAAARRQNRERKLS